MRMVIEIDEQADIRDFLKLGNDMGLAISKSNRGWIVREVKVE